MPDTFERHEKKRTPIYRGEEITTVSHLTTMPLDYVKFTTATSEKVICQKCKEPLSEGKQPHFLQDLTGSAPGKNVCDKCRQYYITKTEKMGHSTRKSN